MASPPSPTSSRRRTNSIAQSVASVSNSVVLHDVPLGFFAATAQATSKAPTVGDIRRGSFGKDGWQNPTNRRSSVTSIPEANTQSTHGAPGQFTPLTEEISETPRGLISEKNQSTTPEISDPAPTYTAEQERTDHDRITKGPSDRAAKRPWTTSTLIGLKAFWKWFTTPFGFLFTLYFANVIAWGGMLFLLLCNASPAMCHAPVPRPENQKHMSPAAALGLPGPYYFNCNDINSPRRIWIEIDSQILNALFCVTGLGLIPWRFRDLYYLLRWRFTSEKKYGRERKMYGLRVLAGINRGWFRLPGSDTMDTLTTEQYVAQLPQQSTTTNTEASLESALSTLPENDPRIPLPLDKKPADPVTGVHAPPTSLWKLDFFVWCFVWNTFFQICLCGFMWGMNRYARPPWSTGLFIACAFIIAGVGGWVSFKEGKRVKKFEGVPPSTDAEAEKKGAGDPAELAQVVTGQESVHVEEKTKHERV